MSIFTVASQLHAKGLRGFTVVAASDDDLYLKSWLQLVASLRDATSIMHAAHWNIRAPNFSELHDHFGKIYNTAFAFTDDAAEQLRVLNIGFEIPLDPQVMRQHSFINIQEVEAQKSGMGKPETRANVLLSYAQLILDKLHAHLKMMNKLAGSNNDAGGADLLGRMAADISKLVWKNRSFEPQV